MIRLVFTNLVDMNNSTADPTSYQSTRLSLNTQEMNHIRRNKLIMMRIDLDIQHSMGVVLTAVATDRIVE